MNLFSRFKPILALTLALFCFESFAIAQPEQFGAPAILTLNIDEQVRMAATANDLAVAKYKLDHANWLRNVDLRKAAGLPDFAAPQPPRITLLDKAIFASVFTAYSTRCLSQALQGLPCGELDVSPALTAVTYPAIAPPAPKPVPAQPDNPIGTPMGAGVFAPAPGDQNPAGFVYTNPIGIKFRKYVLERPFGKAVWYQVIDEIAKCWRMLALGDLQA